MKKSAREYSSKQGSSVSGQSSHPQHRKSVSCRIDLRTSKQESCVFCKQIQMYIIFKGKNAKLKINDRPILRTNCLYSLKINAQEDKMARSTFAMFASIQG
jgi:hypothetical protein